MNIRTPLLKLEARMQIEKKFGNGAANTFLLSAPLVLAFAGLLQCDTAASQQAIPPENTQATATAEQKTDVKGILATVIQSRSTNTLGYRIVIYDDGSTIAEIGGAISALRTEPSRTQQFPPGAIDTKTLRRLLTEIGDVSKIPTGGCAKSASFGTRTLITYGSKTSGDLQCIRQQAPDGDHAPLQASEDLGRFVQKTLGQLKINDRRRIGSNQ
jgi:hypothetical protein